MRRVRSCSTPAAALFVSAKIRFSGRSTPNRVSVPAVRSANSGQPLAVARNGSAPGGAGALPNDDPPHAVDRIDISRKIRRSYECRQRLTHRVLVGSRKLNEEVKLEKNGSTPKLERRCLAVLENVTLIFHQQPAFSQRCPLTAGLADSSKEN